MQRALQWTVLNCFLVSISGCALLSVTGCHDVPRPDTTVCIANVKELKQECYNLLRDYDSRGNLLKDAKPEIRTYLNALAMLDALDKSSNTDPLGWAHLKAYLKDLRSANK